MQNVQVGYQAERDVRAWTARHDAGEVPGRWPYGFDLLERPGIKVEWVELKSTPSRPHGRETDRRDTELSP